MKLKKLRRILILAVMITSLLLSNLTYAFAADVSVSEPFSDTDNQNAIEDNDENTGEPTINNENTSDNKDSPQTEESPDKDQAEPGAESPEGENSTDDSLESEPPADVDADADLDQSDLTTELQAFALLDFVNKEVATFAELKDYIENPDEDLTEYSIKITADLTANDVITLKPGKTYNIIAEPSASITQTATRVRHFIVPAGDTVSLNLDGVTLNGGGVGGGIEAAAMSGLIFNGDITNCNAISGGGILSSGYLQITGGTISYCWATNGGGLYAYSGEAIVEGTTSLQHNTASQTGGGIYFNNTSSATVAGNVQIAHNTAVGAGGIDFYSVGHSYISGNVQVYGNSSTGTVVSSGGAGGVRIWTDLSSKVINASITGNVSITENESVLHGGGLTLQGLANADISGANISGNSGTGNVSCGGVYVWKSANVSFNEVIIDQNKALVSQQAGGLYMLDGSSVSINACEITGNISKSSGVKIYKYNSAVFHDSVISSNTASDSIGGGLHFDKVNTTSFTETTINKNFASHGGGGIYAVECPVFIISKTDISNNTTDSYGGGLYLYGVIDTTITESSINGNTAANSGGGVYAYNSSNISFTESSISDNATTGAHGGGIYYENDLKEPDNTKLTLTDSLVNGNDAPSGQGGGLYFYDTKCLALVSINGGEFSENTAINGGAVRGCNCAEITVSEVDINANTATGAGGGIYLYYVPSFVVDKASISSNTAVDGGGIFLHTVTSTSIDEAEIVGNSADYGGGLEAQYSDNISLNGAAFRNNSASVYGGGLDCYDLLSVKISDCEFSGNSGKYGGGAAFYYLPANAAEISGNTVFEKNHAAMHGGAIWTDKLVNVKISDNSGNKVSFIDNTALFRSMTKEEHQALHEAQILGEYTTTEAAFNEYLYSNYDINYSALPVYYLELAVTPADSGTIDTNDTDFEENSAGDIPCLKEEANVSLTAIPENGYHFSHWLVEGYDISDDEAKNTELSFEMPANDVKATAVFEINTYQVSYQFESGTDGLALPNEIMQLLPDSTTEDFGTRVTPLGFSDISGTGGAWIFQGWNPETVLVDKDVLFVGTWVFETEKYEVTHAFVSGTSGKELPQQVLDLLPDPIGGVSNNTIVNPGKLAATSVAVRGGTWSFKGWSPEQITIKDGDAVFTGTWTFTAQESSSPVTGDNSSLGLWLFAAALSFAGLLVCIICTHKKDGENPA